MSESAVDTSNRQRQKKRSYTSKPVRLEPLVVPPEGAAQLLGIRVSKLYGLLRDGELDSFRCGRMRRVTLESIHRYIDRRLADSAATGWRVWPHNPVSRRKRPENPKDADQVMER